MIKFFSLLFGLISLQLIIGCSNIRITSNDTIPVVFAETENHTRDISIKVTEDFYLWGLFPGTRELRIDKVFGERGYNSIAELEIEEKNDKRNLAWTFFTLGFYTPKSYVLKGKAKRGADHTKDI